MVRMASALIKGFESAVSWFISFVFRGALRAHLDKCVDCQDNKLGLSLGVVHEIQVHELLLLQVVRLLTSQ
jgi:hypothetical protein